MHSLLTFTFLLGAIGAAEAQFPMQLSHNGQNIEPEEIRELVSKYCRVDYEGARLDPQLWGKLQPLVWWKSNPEYTEVSVISRYTVATTPELDRGKYTVTVHYAQLGRFDPAVGYSRDPSNEDVDYTVSAVNGEWRVYDATPNIPHTSVPAMVKWLNTKAAAATDEASRKIYQGALQGLQTPASPPPR